MIKLKIYLLVLYTCINEYSASDNNCGEKNVANLENAINGLSGFGLAARSVSDLHESVERSKLLKYARNVENLVSKFSVISRALGPPGIIASFALDIVRMSSTPECEPNLLAFRKIQSQLHDLKTSINNLADSVKCEFKKHTFLLEIKSYISLLSQRMNYFVASNRSVDRQHFHALCADRSNGIEKLMSNFNLFLFDMDGANVKRIIDECSDSYKQANLIVLYSELEMAWIEISMLLKACESVASHSVEGYTLKQIA
jgi:hypothetical protein